MVQTTLEELLEKLIELHSRPIQTVQQKTDTDKLDLEEGVRVQEQQRNGIGQTRILQEPSGAFPKSLAIETTVVYVNGYQQLLSMRAGNTPSSLTLLLRADLVTAISLSPDRHMIAYSELEPLIKSTGSGTIVIREPLPPSVTLIRSNAAKVGQISNATDPVFSPDGTCIAYRSRTGIYVADSFGHNAREILKLKDQDVRADFISILSGQKQMSDLLSDDGYFLMDWKCGKLLLASSYGHSVLLVDVQTGKTRHHDLNGLQPLPSVSWMQLSPQADKIYYYNRDLKIIELDIETKRTTPISQRYEHLKRPSSLSLRHYPFRISADGQFLGYAAYGGIEVLSLRTGKVVWEIYRGAGIPFDIK